MWQLQRFIPAGKKVVIYYSSVHTSFALVFHSVLLIFQSSTDCDAGHASTSVFLIDRQAAGKGNHHGAA